MLQVKKTTHSFLFGLLKIIVFHNTRQIFEALIHYTIHYKITDAIANIYRNDYTEVQFGEIRREIEIKSGIRQGCTGSTILFLNCDIYDNGRIR